MIHSQSQLNELETSFINQLLNSHMFDVVFISVHRPARHRISKFEMPTPNIHETLNKKISYFS